MASDLLLIIDASSELPPLSITCHPLALLCTEQAPRNQCHDILQLCCVLQRLTGSLSSDMNGSAAPSMGYLMLVTQQRHHSALIKCPVVVKSLKCTPSAMDIFSGNWLMQICL